MNAIRPEGERDDLSRVTDQDELLIVKNLDPWDLDLHNPRHAIFHYRIESQHRLQSPRGRSQCGRHLRLYHRIGLVRRRSVGISPVWLFGRIRATGFAHMR
jgi:hypothetical protein